MTWYVTTLCGTAAVGVAGAVLLRRAYVVITVQGMSMHPTYAPGDRVLVRRGAVPRRGDEVVVESPDRRTLRWRTLSPLSGPSGLSRLSERQWLIKRVVAVSGDPWPAKGAARIPPDHFFLLGDNAASSFDSRQIGPFATDRVLGRVCRRL